MKTIKHKISTFQRLPMWLRHALFRFVMQDFIDQTDEIIRLRDGLQKEINKMPNIYPDNPDRIALENILYNRDRIPKPMLRPLWLDRGWHIYLAHIAD